MRLKASQTGEWPAGLHWTAGEERDVTIPEGAEVPDFLTEAKAKKAKAKAKAKASEA